MITDRLDPTGLATIPGAVNLTIATGSRIIHISGQTGVDADGKVVGSTHLDQSRRALQNLRVAIEAAGATPADIAKLMIYVVDYTKPRSTRSCRPRSRCSATTTRSPRARWSVLPRCGSPTSSSRSTRSRSSDRPALAATRNLTLASGSWNSRRS